MYYIGMMSGTSLDGVDAVLAYHHVEQQAWRVVAHAEANIADELKRKLYRLNFPSIAYPQGELYEAKTAEYTLTQVYAKAYQQLMRQVDISPSRIVGIGAHGQTIRHEPNSEIPYTLQLLDGALLSYLTGQTVVCDFRCKDLAAGGQGAPLAPIFHRFLFSNNNASDTTIAVINIGGIANISLIGHQKTIGFDCGPGNCLLDEWIAEHQGYSFDYNGDWAAQGKLLPGLLSRLLDEDYFQQLPPKSTGRDYFNREWLASYLAGDERPVDVMYTLTALTAKSIASSISDEVQSVILAGGGAKNALLRQLIADYTGKTVQVSDDFGIDVQMVESLGFAMLAQQTLSHQAVDTRLITGAKRPIILGAVYYTE